MTSFTILMQSFAAPWFSDTSSVTVEAECETEALEKAVANYNHPSGLYSAGVYDASGGTNGAPLKTWLCNHEIAKREATKNQTGYSYLGNGPGDFEINGESFKIPNPKGGRII